MYIRQNYVDLHHSALYPAEFCPSILVLRQKNIVADVRTIVLAPPPPPPHCPPKKVKMEWPELKAYFTDCHSVNGTHTNFVNALCSCEIINVFVNGRIDDGCRNMTTVPLLKTGQRREIKAVVRFLHAEGNF